MDKFEYTDTYHSLERNLESSDSGKNLVSRDIWISVRYKLTIDFMINPSFWAIVNKNLATRDSFSDLSSN